MAPDRRTEAILNIFSLAVERIQGAQMQPELDTYRLIRISCLLVLAPKVPHCHPLNEITALI